MSIMIDKSKCIGCGKCCMVCPGSLIKKDGDNKCIYKVPERLLGAVLPVSRNVLCTQYRFILVRI